MLVKSYRSHDKNVYEMCLLFQNGLVLLVLIVVILNLSDYLVLD